MDIVFKNESGLEFTDIASEKWQAYHFPDGTHIQIEAPQALHVSKHGHRVIAQKRSYYIPFGWKYLEWEVHPDQPQTVR